MDIILLSCTAHHMELHAWVVAPLLALLQSVNLVTTVNVTAYAFTPRANQRAD